MKIILGSKSQARKAIITQLGYDFTILNPNIDETKIRNKDPKKLALDLAYAKAAALLPQIKEPAILITCDTVVYCNNKLIEKPKDKEEAKSFLQLYSSHPADVITAIVVTNTATKKQVHAIDIATIWFEKIPQKIMQYLVDQGTTLNYAGGFSVEDPVFTKYIKKIEGSKESIMGLSKKLITDLIDKIINT
jgi:septum formation protein